MPSLSFVPRVRRVDPRSHRGLEGFTCGTSEDDQAIDDLLDVVRAGLTRTTVIVAEAPDARTVGVAAYSTRTLLYPGPTPVPGYEEAPYVLLIARSAAFRGYRIPDDEERTIGDLLLGATLDDMAALHGGRLPGVWTMVPPASHQTHELFRRHGFTIHLAAASPTRGHDFRIRPPENLA